ncbi:MAG: hypothetical protein ACK5KN_13125 [Dysgonomonas sp.]|jgi:hypothetical protein|uniref:hypothetical protein n=1 Tax=unclassified Dysgonomonas TaxID=2630389 RepID=UPI0025C05134|nr:MULTISPECIES: hypothetical protein [unclassified Dysgonomonas]MDR1714817.1 hypothetical protein [Prevotella sp.]MDR2002500.1 hypothetical protein [Prevotella sp.]HMM04803.1 hypothetical protein [Dysgonomonas sp.]
MFTIREIRITGITRLKVNIETDDIEHIRSECARTYKVSKSKVKFVYDERE